MSLSILCPKCGSGVPVPRFARDGGALSVRCRTCASLLQLHRPSRDPRKTDSAVELGRQIRIPGYEIIGVLGKGGMGMVFSAVRALDSQLVAIKVLPPECSIHPELVQRFEMEAQMMASLAHPAIVPILDRGRVAEHYFLVADYIPGCNLRERIANAAPLGIDEVLAIATPVSEGIQFCHENDLVHRDLKPANILLCHDGRVLVTDFGIANLMQRLGDQTEHGVTIGTPQYVAPEQLRDGSKVGVRADQYSLAVIVYEMLTGQLPMGVFEPPSRICPELTSQAEVTLLRALSRDPAKRYESMRQFMRAFRRSLNRPDEAPDGATLVRAAATECHLEENTPGPASGEFQVNLLSRGQGSPDAGPAAPLITPLPLPGTAESSDSLNLRPMRTPSTPMVNRHHTPATGGLESPAPLLARQDAGEVMSKSDVNLLAIAVVVCLLVLLLLALAVMIGG